jgi:hypothetical protein
MRVTRYKVVETQTVTDEDLEEIINEWVSAGWIFDGMQFAMRDSSKRPAMAFVVFTRTEHVEPDADEGVAAEAEADDGDASSPDGDPEHDAE